MSKLSVRHQDLYKAKTPPWKETYRKRCLAKFREGRANLQSKFRKVADGSMEAKFCDQRQYIKQVMKEELDNIKKERTAITDTDYTFEPWDFENIDEVLNLFDDIQEELRIEEEKLLSACEEYESSLLKEEAILCSALDKLSTDDVLCPVCQRYPLLLNKGIICCKCGIRINTAQDCISLTNVKQTLVDATDMHASCESTAIFFVTSEYGADNLLMTCKDCDFMYVIV